MKKRVVKKSYRHLDKNTFLILTCVVIALLVLFGSQTGTLPEFLIK